VIIVPSLIRDVRAAATARTCHGSTTAPPARYRNGPGDPRGSTRQARPARHRFPAGPDRPGPRGSRAPPARAARQPRRPDRDDQPPGERTSGTGGCHRQGATPGLHEP
jgi:hypothetical protein